MIPRGSSVRLLVTVAALAAVVIPMSRVGATTTVPVSDNARTVTISVPGPFNGCTSLDSGATPTSNAVLDLVRPSAFLTTTGGNLVGEGGPIATAELTSLQPETVVYTVAASQLWSNGLIFSGADLLDWWRRARTLPSVQSDGYRAIKTLTESPDGLRVTAVFATPYADWNLLFRDVEARGTAPGCAIHNLVSRPSLGPYNVASASASRIVLTMNPMWKNDTGRFGRIVLTTNGSLPSNVAEPFANYSLVVNRAQAQALSAHPTVLSHIGTSSNIEEIAFAPQRPLTQPVRLREALSWSLNRQAIINQLWGAITFSPSVAASALFSQGQSGYPNSAGGGPTSQTTTTSTTVPGGSGPSGLLDCVSCALSALRSAGYHRSGQGWFSASGTALAVRVAIGPSDLDRVSADAVIRQWEAFGIHATGVNVSSDRAAAAMAASNGADAAIFARPTITAPSYVARSWYGPSYTDTYPNGNRSKAVNALYAEAISNFNPVAARSTWLSLDKVVMNNFWVRPLFTAPSLVEWSGSIATVYGSLSISGFLDQATNWNTISTPKG